MKKWMERGAKVSPVTLASAALLHLLWVDALVAMLGKVAREMLRRGGSAFGQADVVTVVGLVRSGH